MPRHDLVANLDSFNPGAEFDDLPCRLPPRHKGPLRPELVIPGRPQHIHILDDPRANQDHHHKGRGHPPLD